MLYAFGDVPEPLPETVALMGDIVTEYLIDICHQAAAVSGNRAKIKVDDFKFVLRKDRPKLGRIQELLHMQKVIADARKQYKFDEKDTAS